MWPGSEVELPKERIKEKKHFFFFFFKWHTATSAGYFSPYTSILNMINSGTHWGKRKGNKSTLVYFPIRSHSPAGSALKLSVL